MSNPYVTITRNPHPSSMKPITVDIIDNYYRTIIPLDAEMAWDGAKWTRPEDTSSEAGINIRYVPEKTKHMFDDLNAPTDLITKGATVQDVKDAIYMSSLMS